MMTFHRPLLQTVVAAALAAGCIVDPSQPPSQRGGDAVGGAPALAPPTRVEALPPPLSAVGSPTFVARDATRPPPPIAGGTLLVLRDDRTAVASDPDLDVVWVVDLRGDVAPRRVELRPGDEPGRAVEDSEGRVHVALRRGGAVVTLDAAAAAITARRSVCPAPRGVAWDGRHLHVACAGGELVTLGAEGDERRTMQLEPDLRDVVARGDSLYVTQFRSAVVFEVRGGSARALSAPPTYLQPDAMTRYPALAWRAVPVGSDVVMLHQSALGMIATARPDGNAYGSVESPASVARVPMIARLSTLSTTAVDGPSWTSGVSMLDAGFAVDVAARVDSEGRRAVAVASPGWATHRGVRQVRVSWTDARGATERAGVRTPTGQAVAVAWTSAGALVVQTRASGSLLIADDPRVDIVRAINLYDDDAEGAAVRVGDVGHDVFHAATSAGVACASCHPEGGEDGRTWTFGDIGRRRTPSLRGGVMKTAPFHWDGDLRDIGELVSEVFVRRMGGPSLQRAALDGLGAWLDTIPAVPASAPADPSAAARGAALFDAPSVGCAECHAGAAFTNNERAAVGTGGSFQVPPLTGLWLRAPYMHDGRTASLRARFTDPTAGGDLHGRTSQLTQSQREDLVAFLATL